MENQYLTADNRTPEEIQHEMAETREALTEKVAALEDQVVGTVQTAADTLTGTVDSMRSLIANAPEAVGDSVKHAAEVVSKTLKKTFDLSGHVREHPWAAVGISALAGCMTGWLVSRSRAAVPAAPPRSVAPPAAASVLPPATPSPGLFDELLSMLGRRLREVAEIVVDSATGALNKNVREEVPKLVDAAVGVASDRLSNRESTGPRFATFTG